MVTNKLEKEVKNNNIKQLKSQLKVKRKIFLNKLNKISIFLWKILII